MAAPRVAAIGGGTGLPRVLRALVAMGADPTAVVTMADDGGSSGRLRRTYGMLPPGDVRNCLVALAEPGSELARVFQYRFEHGEELAGHAVGNLILASLADLDGSFPAAIATAEQLLATRGHVLPSTVDDIELHAKDARGTVISGQALVACSPDIATVYLEPGEPDAFEPAVEAIERADAVLVGPGSLFTSVLPNFLVPGILAALKRSKAAGVTYICNVANQRGETHGMDCVDHVRALLEHGLAGIVTTVVVHDTDRFPPPADAAAPPVICGAEEQERLAGLGLEVVAAELVDPGDPLRHDIARLTDVLPEVIV